MNSKESSSNTQSREQNTKDERTLITERDYRNRHGSCAMMCFPYAGAACFACIAFVPLILSAFRFIPGLTSEVRLVSGLLPALPAGYAVAKYTREKCENDIEEQYYYIPNQTNYFPLNN